MTVSGDSVSLGHHPPGTILLQSSSLAGGQFLLQSPIQIVQAAPSPSTSSSSSSHLVHSGIKRSFEFAEIVGGNASSSSASAAATLVSGGATASSSSSHARNSSLTTNSASSSSDFLSGAFIESKRKKEEKGGKGLRHFSMKVCEKVRAKGHTTYNEVADELVSEFAQDQQNAAINGDQVYDQKNIRRRVYDALNVLMAMNIISKEKKEIKWIGLPTNSAEEHQRLEQEKRMRIDRIAQKTRELHDLILYQIAYKNLVNRNRKAEQKNGPPGPSSAIPLPFVIVNTGKKTVIDCSISSDKTEYLFQFDNGKYARSVEHGRGRWAGVMAKRVGLEDRDKRWNAKKTRGFTNSLTFSSPSPTSVFEINEEKDVLNMMGMTLGLDKPGQCTQANLAKAKSLVPRALEPYVVDIYNGVGRGDDANAANGGNLSANTGT